MALERVTSDLTLSVKSFLAQCTGSCHPASDVGILNCRRDDTVTLLFFTVIWLV